MGASHSRARPGTGPAKITKFQFGKSQMQPATGYFIISLKGDRIKVVNAESPELKGLTCIIRRHCKIVKEGWDRHLTYMYKLKKVGRHMMIQLVADFLLSLYQAGWEPMTPIDMGIQKAATGSGPSTAICFRRKYDAEEQQQVFGSNTSLLSQCGSSKEGDNNCLCLETYRDSYIGFHDVTNTVLYELVETIQNEWSPGIKGVSMAVSSVISDYTTTMPSVLPGIPEVQGAKYLQLEGAPWSRDTNVELDDTLSAENLQLSIIACLSREGYKLSMSINMDTFSHVYFFIKDRDESRGEVRVPNMAGAGLGEKDTLSVYRPMVVRSKSSFFRSYTSRNGTVRRKVRPSLRKKAVIKSTTVKQQQQQQQQQLTSTPSTQQQTSKADGERSSSSGESTPARSLSSTGASHRPAMSYKPLSKEPAWWQQTSTDVSSDHEDFL